ncbi:MAG: hypothetical protein Q9200_001417 [Gallowayella weberi]
MFPLRFFGLFWTIHLATGVNSSFSIKPERTTTDSNHMPSLRVIPNPFTWRPYPNNKIVFYRKKIPHRPTPDNPGVSRASWQHAISKAEERLAIMQQEAHSAPTDFIPGNRFDYEGTAASQKMRSTFKRIRFQIDSSTLEYGRVQVALLGLEAYKHIWDAAGQAQQILMCNFTYMWTPGNGLAHGRAIISVHRELLDTSPDVS